MIYTLRITVFLLKDGVFFDIFPKIKNESNIVSLFVNKVYNLIRKIVVTLHYQFEITIINHILLTKTENL